MAFDPAASLAALDRQDAGNAVKITEDLDRYAAVIARSGPEAVIECGTWRGGSALWFARQGLAVVTIDTDPRRACAEARADERIMFLAGDSADPAVIAAAAAAVKGRRVMVVLDSDHSPGHVRREIEAYGPLVTAGCYLVVEDGLIRWIPSPFPARLAGPLDAVELLLAGDPRWRRDRETEEMHPVTMSPMGWWQRVA